MNEILSAILLATLSMHDAVSRAIVHSPEIRALQAQLDQARANANATDAFRPSASISTTPGYATGLPTAVLGQVPAIATVEAHKILYDTSARAELAGAESEADAAEARLESRKRDIAQDAAALYARVVAGPQLLASAHRRIEAYATISAHTKALRAEGRARDIDVNRAELQLASAERERLQNESRLEMDQLRLDKMTGGAEGVEDSGPPLSGQPGAAVLHDDPELSSLDKRIVALQSVLAAEQRLFKPTIAAQVQYSRLFDRYGRFYLNFKPDDFSAAASVTLPIWTGGRRTAVVERLRAQLQELTALRDARRTELELTLREAETDLKQAEAARDLAMRSRAVAQEGFRIADELQKEGRGEANDVPLAQIALSEAEDDVTNAEAHVAAARAKLQIVRGQPI